MQSVMNVAAEVPLEEGSSGDFRTRSAARRRQRMRLRLLEATMTACAQRERGNVVIDDVLRAADVSRGTFYAHFDSLQDAIDIVAQRWVEESMVIYDGIYVDVEPSPRKAALGFQLLMIRSMVQPSWGSTILQGYGYLSKSALVRSMRADIARSMRSGTFRRGDVQAAVDLTLGTMLQGVRTLTERPGKGLNYIRTLSESLLLGLGVPEAEAQAEVAWATNDLMTQGPKHLEWWKDIS